MEAYDLRGEPLGAQVFAELWESAFANVFWIPSSGEWSQVVYAAGRLISEKLPEPATPMIDSKVEAVSLPGVAPKKGQLIRNVHKVVIHTQPLRHTVGLVTRRGRLFELVPSAFDIQVRDTGERYVHRDGDVTATLRDVDGHAALSSGEWADGSEVWVDRRGFIHFSPAGAPGQLSVVLRQGVVSCWHTEEGFHGLDEDLGEASELSSSPAILAFFLVLRQFG